MLYERFTFYNRFYIVNISFLFLFSLFITDLSCTSFSQTPSVFPRWSVRRFCRAARRCLSWTWCSSPRSGPRVGLEAPGPSPGCPEPAPASWAAGRPASRPWPRGRAAPSAGRPGRRPRWRRWPGRGCRGPTAGGSPGTRCSARSARESDCCGRPRPRWRVPGLPGGRGGGSSWGWGSIGRWWPGRG